MKYLNLLLFCLLSNTFFAQINFSNEKLALTQEIYYNSTRSTINDFMKKKGFTVEKPFIINSTENGDILSYSSEFMAVQVDYTLNKKIESVTITYDGAPNNIFIELELAEKGFIQKDGGKMYGYEQGDSSNAWTKSGLKQAFVTFENEEEKIGILAFGIPEK